MCWSCDHPGSTDEDYLAMMIDTMQRHGWAVQGVEGDARHRPWAYTVGLTVGGLPELAVTGMELGLAATLLNTFAGEFVHHGMPAPGERIPLCDGRTVEIVEVPNPDVYLYTAISLFELPAGAAEAFPGGVRALQLVWCDSRGHWPWEPAFRGLQTLMGPRAAAA